MGGTKAYVIATRQESSDRERLVAEKSGRRVVARHLNARPTPVKTKPVIFGSERAPSTLALVSLLFLHLIELTQATAAPFYQLVGQASEEARLPCLIGLPTFCGEPYFIAWYRLNASGKSWDRIEHNAAGESLEDQKQVIIRATGHRSLRERVKFERGSYEQVPSSLCERHSSLPRNSSPAQQPMAAATNFECAQLSISQLELSDEGQYKCEITFSDSLDFDKCPATTLSQLNVIARPNEPELLVNGRATTRQVSAAGRLGGVSLQSGQAQFKEGSQVRLECRSSGGRPAPRIEWLNVSSSSWPPNMNKVGAASEWQLMRSWPHKQTTAFLPQDPLSTSAPVQVTSNSMTVTISRFDLQSSFVCLVIPRHHHHPNQNQQQMLDEEEKLLKSSAYLNAAYFNSINPSGPMSASAGLWQRWLKLDVQVKPASARLIVLDLESNATLQPLHWAAGSPAALHSGARQQTIEVKPYYSLLANRLYAIQCLVEDSRPRSQVTWFNRTLPIGLEPTVLGAAGDDASDYLLPSSLSGHRLSSFTRTREHANGTTSTSATLLLTTSVWDNFEEFFCRVSNEAFQMDELDQVAPIQSARLQVNYAPHAWLEVERPATRSALVRPETGAELHLRCWVAANPLPQNTIVQIDWLQDGRKLAPPGTKQPHNNDQQQQQQQQAARLQIEKANHLHMPIAPSGGPADDSRSPGGERNQLASNQQREANKLIRSSTLAIGSLTKSNSGNYSCQFKLIPAPSNQQQQQPAQNQQKPIRITSGQANQSIQVDVIEARPRRPTLRIQSSAGDVLIYGLKSAPPDVGKKRQQSGRVKKRSNKLLTLLVDPSAPLSLKCDLPTSLRAELAHKVIWYLNGAHLHTSGSQDTFNLTLKQLSAGNELDPLSGASIRPHPNRQRGGSITCAYHILRGSSSGNELIGADNSFNAGAMRVLTSLNELELRSKVEARLVSEKRELIMPQVRSFSELELASSPAQKLKLVCLAQCEPICSIDWLLNGRHLASSTGRSRPTAASWSEQALAASEVASNPEQLQTESLMLTTAMESTSGITPVARLDHSGANGGAPLMGATLVENLIRRVAAPTFGWLRTSGWTLTNWPTTTGAINGKQPQQRWDEPGLEWASRQLMRDAGQAELGSSNSGNVFSQLELTYSQISRLLQLGKQQSIPSAEEDGGQITVKCKVNTSLGRGANAVTFGHFVLPPKRWFPAGSLSSDLVDGSGGIDDAGDDDANEVAPTLVDSGSSGDADDKTLRLSDEPLNLTRLLPLSLQMELQQQQSVDEMQISILLDKSPGRVQVSFAGIESTSDAPAGATITELQLAELTSTNSQTDRAFQCRTLGRSFPPAQYRWTFTSDLETKHELNLDAPVTNATDGSQLSLRRFIGTMAQQRHLATANQTAWPSRVGLVTGIVGNYTCTAFNQHGTRSATLPLQVQGRPICRLALGGQSLSADNELVAKLECSIYSVPALVETVWFRGSQQLLVNRTAQAELGFEDQKALSRVELPVFVLNKQQEFMLSDLSNQPSSNFKCIARNSIGYSEACELSQSDRQILMNTLRPLANPLNDNRSPALSMVQFFPSESKHTGNLLGNFQLANGSISGAEMPAPTGSSSLMRSLLPLRLDWLLMAACSLVIVWLVFISSSSLLKRKCLGPGKNKLRGGKTKKPNTSWRFNPSRSCSNNETLGAPFQSGKTICVNYYGGSNGDSEHDMMHSACSQSSHYEEFVRENQHQMIQQTQQRLLSHQQPIYFNGSNNNLNNGHSTLARRTLKQSSMSNSTASTGIVGMENQYSRHQQLTRLTEGMMNASMVREPIPTGHGQRYAASTLAPASNNVVPLISGNGTLSSRINIDQPPPVERRQQYQQHYAHQQQPLRNEHIYDDVIYNQMIL